MEKKIEWWCWCWCWWQITITIIKYKQSELHLYQQFLHLIKTLWMIQQSETEKNLHTQRWGWWRRCQIASSTDNRSFFSCDNFSIKISNKLHLLRIFDRINMCCLFLCRLLIFGFYSFVLTRSHSSNYINHKNVRDLTFFYLFFNFKTKNQHLLNNSKIDS